MPRPKHENLCARFASTSRRDVLIRDGDRGESLTVCSWHANDDPFSGQLFGQVHLIAGAVLLKLNIRNTVADPDSGSRGGVEIPDCICTYGRAACDKVACRREHDMGGNWIVMKVVYWQLELINLKGARGLKGLADSRLHSTLQSIARKWVFQPLR